MAVWNAASATTLPGKMLGLWGPIATFVTIGLVSPPICDLPPPHSQRSLDPELILSPSSAPPV